MQTLAYYVRTMSNLGRTMFAMIIVCNDYCLYKQCSGDFMFVTQANSYGLVFAYYTNWNSHC